MTEKSSKREQCIIISLALFLAFLSSNFDLFGITLEPTDKVWIAEITTPFTNTVKVIGDPFIVAGRVLPVPQEKDLWLVHRRDMWGLGWPREHQVEPNSRGEFSMEAWDNGEPGKLYICLMAVDQKVSAEWRDWIQQGQKTGYLPPIQLNRLEATKEIKELVQVKVWLVSAWLYYLLISMIVPISAISFLIIRNKMRNKKNKIDDKQEECQKAKSKFKDPKKVFIVHGHDSEPKEMVARFILQLNLKPVILHEQPDKGRTIIEKFEDYSNASYAIILLTPDDKGYPVSNDSLKEDRARQNVVFEFGYFIGTLGRNKVCGLLKGRVDLPSDYSGVLYIELDQLGAWKLKLAREMKQAGLDVDMNAIV